MKSMLSIDENTKLQYTGLYLLTTLHKNLLTLSQKDAYKSETLAKVIQWLELQAYIKTDNDGTYILQEKGLSILGSFMSRHKDFLENYDVFCAVDLEEGEFAFSYYDEFSNEDDWQKFLSDSRWDDFTSCSCRI